MNASPIEILLAKRRRLRHCLVDLNTKQDLALIGSTLIEFLLEKDSPLLIGPLAALQILVDVTIIPIPLAVPRQARVGRRSRHDRLVAL